MFNIWGEMIVKGRGSRTEWQPMESAPRDGTTILVYHSYEKHVFDSFMQKREDPFATTLYEECIDMGAWEISSGVHTAFFGLDFDDRTWEYPDEGWFDGYWFSSTSQEIEGGTVLKPILWMPLPTVGSR